MKSKKRIIASLVACVMLIAIACAFAACGGIPEPAKVTELKITTPPATTKYYEGDFFDDTGMVVTATFDDDTSKTILTYAYDEEPLARGQDKVVISYKQGDITKTVDVPIQVTNRWACLEATAKIRRGSNELDGKITIRSDGVWMITGTTTILSGTWTHTAGGGLVFGNSNVTVTVNADESLTISFASGSGNNAYSGQFDWSAEDYAEADFNQLKI